MEKKTLTFPLKLKNTYLRQTTLKAFHGKPTEVSEFISICLSCVTSFPHARLYFLKSCAV